MKTVGQKHRRTTAALLCTTLLGTCGFATTAQPVAVNGSYSYTRANGDIESVDFHAVQKPDGTVSGEVHNSLRFENTVFFHSHLRIDCMTFLDENTVILGGVDVLDSDPEYIGNTVVIIVRDNGEGQAAVPDQGTDVFYSDNAGFDLDCQVSYDLITGGLFDLEAAMHSAETGNIQIAP